MPPRRRNILFVTTDQQRWDSLGCNGGAIARTPAVDGLAAAGIRYERPHVQNVVCMPSRATMVTGQHVRSHGVTGNGVVLPVDHPTVVHALHDAGYRTGLVGKSHYEPLLDLGHRWRQNRMSWTGSTGPWRGFDRVELASHSPLPSTHYGQWLLRHHPRDLLGFGMVLTGKRGGDTAAPEVATNPIATERYHSAWVADRALAFLRDAGDAPWFLWASFPDPHHPWDPPARERARVPWRDLDLPPNHPGSPARARELLATKPRHWLDWYEGRFHNPEGGPVRFVPSQLTDDQVREINALIHVENELIDDALARILAGLRDAGVDADTDIFFTSDHGELQGDFGLMFKGPYHVDALLRVPLVWRPAPSAGIAAAVVPEPVGLVDLAPTFCAIAGIPPLPTFEGAALPTAPGSGRRRVLTEFDSQFREVGMHLRTMFTGRHLVTVYRRSTTDRGGRFPVLELFWPKGDIPRYDGTEGELYDVVDDPQQRRNLWHDPAARGLRAELVEELAAALPAGRATPLPVSAPT
ncbi:MAG: sulfatase-like hydrolase/transferase [Myxococcales bacterium]|nr:sulfatase-like hydrolase/transferase [Myxococcales bacterium]